MSKSITLSGYARLKCIGVDGKVKWDTGFMKNTITTAGLHVVAGLVGNVGAENAFTYLAVGTDATAESAAHTALQAETTTNGLERAAATVSTVDSGTGYVDTLQLVKTWTASGSVTVEEVGAFNAASTGDMLGRKLTTTKSVVSGEKLEATYKFIFS